MGLGGQRKSPAALLPGKRPGTVFTGGWVSPRVGLDFCQEYSQELSMPTSEQNSL